jgi:hypothetical protein
VTVILSDMAHPITSLLAKAGDRVPDLAPRGATRTPQAKAARSVLVNDGSCVAEGSNSQWQDGVRI